MTTEFRPPSYPASSEGDADDNYGLNGTNPKDAVLGSNNAQTNYTNLSYGKGEPKVTVTRPARLGLFQWFGNLSVGRKQLTGLFTSEIISVLGLVGIGSFLIVAGGRSQLLNQAKSELSVTDIGYNIKINQMGFGFRGQSDNRAIIQVATDAAQGEFVSAESLEAVRQILQNEVKARNIEYATLVSNDLEIIASANADRTGEVFDPEGLVGTVLQNPRQIKASAIVPWEELQKEQPPLPAGFTNQNALIRYTFTPVTAPESDQVVGVLVSGDIVNSKDGIPKSTLSAFGNGYSAVYQRQENGQFILATSMDMEDGAGVEAAVPNVPLADQDLLEQAVADPEQVIALRDEVGSKTYTLAAKAIENFGGEPIGVLVRGSSEAALNSMIANSLKLQLLIALVALAADVLLAQLLGRSILKPLRNLQQAAWRFGLGDRQARADIYTTDEVGRVAQVFNQLAESINQSESRLQAQAQAEKLTARRANLLAELTTRIRDSLDESSILSTSVEGLREVLGVDRVLVYQFSLDSDGGYVAAESVANGWQKAAAPSIAASLSPEAIERCRAGQVTYEENLDRQNLDVKANMMAPLIVGDTLLGLLCVHQCASPRRWDKGEITLIQQLSVQIGYALTQARLLAEQRKTAIRERQLIELTSSIRQFVDEESILTTSVEGLREALNVDRVLIYRFNANFVGGTVTAESVIGGWTRAKDTQLDDPLAPDVLERYRSGQVTYREDRVRDENDQAITHCHCEILEGLQVQANMVAPLLAGAELVGLLCAHQCSGPRQWEQGEIDLMQQVAVQVGSALAQARLLEKQALSAEKERQLNEIVSRMRESLEESKIYQAAVNDTRQVLKTDRTVVYLFDENWKGTFVAESVGAEWPSAFGQDIYDPCFADKYIEQYRQGRVQATTDIQTAGLTECHLKQLEPFKVKANLVAPIVVREQLIGLLITHQCAHIREWKQLDINFFRQVAVQLGFALEQAQLFSQQELAADKERQLNEIVSRMRESLDEEKIYRIAVNDTRQVLKTDRTVVYLFDETWKGTFVAESVGEGWPSAFGQDIYDPCFADKYVEQYRQGRIQATPNIQEAGLTECHLKQLEPFKVKANLVAPIIVDETLIGLLITHQCSGPRQWQQLEINFFRQVAVQLGFALEQARLFTKTEALSQERLQRQQALQMQLIELLSDVEGASRGDLTVRADVTTGEIGTVADFFNAIVESSRQIVTQVKQSAELVNAAVGENEGAVRTLADDALRQAEEVTRTLNSLEVMTQSIQQVADNAQQAAVVAKTASSTAENSGQAMDLTVQNILNLREIIGETSKKVKRLGESSQQISKVVSLINQIAMQTNLLAINAGIEAARAGEEGQGFAVVAEEVGELAARSADATQEIERIVETIQRETVEVVEAMEQSTTEVVAGTQLVEDAKQSLGRILEVSRQIDELVQSVSEATVSQVEVSETVTQLMQDIAQVSARTSESSRQISGSLRQTVEVAQALQSSVGTFKTEE